MPQPDYMVTCPDCAREQLDSHAREENGHIITCQCGTTIGLQTGGELSGIRVLEDCFECGNRQWETKDVTEEHVVADCTQCGLTAEVWFNA